MSFSPGTFMAQNFIFKTSTILYCIRKRISRIIYSFISIHSVITENDKNVPLSFCDFHTNEVRGAHLVFSRFHSRTFESGKSLGRKVHFFQLPWGNQNLMEFQTLYINVVLLLNFSEQFELCFYLKYSRQVIKFYNLDNKSFETEFSYWDTCCHYTPTACCYATRAYEIRLYVKDRKRRFDRIWLLFPQVWRNLTKFKGLSMTYSCFHSSKRIFGRQFG